MEKLIIAACICGAEITKDQNPAIPYTVEEIVREAKSAVAAPDEARKILNINKNS